MQVKERRADGIILMGDGSHTEIKQEIVVKKDGSIEIPWITPKATALVLELWGEFNNDQPFPVKILHGNVYCG